MNAVPKTALLGIGNAARLVARSGRANALRQRDVRATFILRREAGGEEADGIEKARDSLGSASLQEDDSRGIWRFTMAGKIDYVLEAPTVVLAEGLSGFVR